MRYIKLFLAMSEEELREERMELSDYIRSLNDLYVERGIFFELCESGTADDRLIDEAQYFFLLFYRNAEHKLLEEFDRALETFSAKGAPKIVTYFKVAEERAISEEVRSFMKRLETGLEHFYNHFESLDTVKLGMLLEMARNEETKLELRLEDGRLYANEREVESISLSKIPQYFRNEALNRLREEKRKLEEEYIRLREAFRENPDDDRILKELHGVNEKKNEAEEQFHQVERDILKMTSNIVEMTAGGKPLTVRAKKAIEYFNQGDYERCKHVLDDEERRAAWKRIEENEEESNKRFREEREGCLNEIRIKIDTIKAQGINTQTEGEILELYEEATEKIFKHGLGLELAVDYVDFLWEQKHFSKGVEVGEAVYERLKRDTDIEPYLYRRILGLLGILYDDTGRYEEAEVMHRKALEIYRELSEKNRSVYIGSVAGSCNNLGILYNDTGRYEEAEVMYRKALEIYRELSEENRSAYIGDVADSCNNLGNVYYKTGRYEEAEKLHRKALEIREELSTENRSAYIGDVADSYNNLGNVYYKTGRYEEAEAMHRKALEIREELSTENRSAYIGSVATSCNNLGILYGNTGRYEEAEAMYRKALEIYRELSEENRSAYIGDVADSCNNLGNVYYKTGRYEEAEKLHRKALEIREELSTENRSAYIGRVADSCNNLGNVYYKTEQYKKSENMYKKALHIYAELKELGADEDGTGNVIIIYKNLSVLYRTIGQTREAERIDSIIESIRKDNENES